MFYFFGINVFNFDLPKTGGQLRFREAFGCFSEDAVLISSFFELLKVVFKKNATFVCFDERYLFLMLPLLIVRRKVFFFPRGNKLIHFSDCYSNFRLFFYKKFFSFLYSLCHKLVFQTRAQYLEFRDMYSFKGEYSVLPNHIRASWMLDLFHVDEKPFIPGGILQIGFLGGMSSRKGFKLAYEALEPLIQKKQVNLIVAGGTKDEFSDFDVEALGHTDDLVSFYSRCDLIIVPSKYDSFPNVFLESLASSRIPLLTLDPITQDICGPNSRLLFHRNVQSIHTIISKFIIDESFRNDLRLECKELKSKYDFDWCIAIKNILKAEKI